MHPENDSMPATDMLASGIRQKLFHSLPVVMLAALLGAGCRVQSGEAPPVQGQLTARGAALGDWEIALDRCDSGYHLGFFGVDLTRADDRRIRVRLLEDPLRGRVLRVSAAERIGDDPCPDCIIGPRPARIGDKEITLESGACQVFDTVLEHEAQRARSNAFPWVVEGRLRVDCELPGGGRLIGSAEFKDCYPPGR
jgi:hypothetical protein